MVSPNIVSVVSKVVKDIKEWNIRSSSGAAEIALENLAEIVKLSSSVKDLVENVTYAVNEIISSRPTSAMLINSSREILLTLKHNLEENIDFKSNVSLILKKISYLLRKSREDIEKISTIGANRIVHGDIIITTTYSKTIMKIFERALAQDKKFEVYVAESRPGDDGKIIASKLSKMNIPVTLIVDSAMRYFMKDVTKAFLGAEAVAANGAVISKVGSSLLALVAHEARVRVFVASSTLKLSYETIFGELIKIPHAPERTIIDEEIKRKIGEKLKVEIPLLDVIPPEYVDAIITEYGVIAPQAIPILMKQIYGKWPPEYPDIQTLISEVRKCLQ